MSRLRDRLARLEAAVAAREDDADERRAMLRALSDDDLHELAGRVEALHVEAERRGVAVGVLVVQDAACRETARELRDWFETRARLGRTQETAWNDEVSEEATGC